MPYRKRISNSDSKYCRKYGKPYIDQWNAAAANDVLGVSVVNLGQQTYPPDIFQIYRPVFFFDLSTLAGRTCYSVRWYFKLNADYSDTDFDITCLAISGISQPPVVADYGTLKGATTSYGTKNTNGLAVETWYYIEFNSTGVAAVGAAFGSTFAMAGRSSREIAGTEPTGNEMVYIYTTGASGSYLAVDASGQPAHSIWVESTELHYGDGQEYERYFEGVDSTENGVAGKIGVAAAATSLRYCDENGDIRAISPDADTLANDTPRKIGYESGGTNLRWADFNGNVQEAEGTLA